MNPTLILTAPNCFRPPAVLEHVQYVLQTGGSVAMATRDHPETLPDSVEFASFAANDWDGARRQGASLTVLDNLRFRDCRGQVFERWSAEGWQRHPLRDIEQFVIETAAAPPHSLLLVSGDASVSGAWRSWLGLHGIRIEKHVGHRSRHWRIMAHDRRVLWPGMLEDEGDPAPCAAALRTRMLPESARRFESEVVDPAQEALLAMVAEYGTLHWDYRNPADPLWLNASDETIRDILASYCGCSDPRPLLEALETLHDAVSEFADFRALGRHDPDGGLSNA